MTDDELTKEAGRLFVSLASLPHGFYQTEVAVYRITESLRSVAEKASAAGYEEAREAAAKVAHKRGTDTMTCQFEEFAESIARLIRRMKPEGIMRLEGLGKDLRYPPDYVKDLRQEPEGDGK